MYDQGKVVFLSDTTQPKLKKIVFWNAAGSLCSAASSFLYLFIVTRVMGAKVAGAWSITIAIAQLMWTIGVFEATTYFATDANNRFTSEQYFGFKFITCALMAVVSFFYVMSFGFDAYKMTLALWLCALKLVDAFGMYYFAAFQKTGRLDISGFSSVWQVLVSVISFTFMVLSFKNVIAGVVAATVCKALWIVIYNTRRLKQIAPITGPDFNPQAMKGLFFELLPLFLATYMANYLSNIPKYAIESLGTSTMQAKFSIVFMPSFVINLFLIFVMRPLLTPLANTWARRQVRSFLSTTVKILVAVVGMTLAVLGLSWFIGIPILEAVFNLDLTSARTAMMVVMAGGGLASCSNVLYNGIIILRRQRLVLVAYTIALILAGALSTPLVSHLGLTGAALTYGVASAALLAVYAVVFIISVKSETRCSQEAS